MFNDKCSRTLKRVYKLDKITPVLFVGRNGWRACLEMRKLQIPSLASETEIESRERREIWDRESHQAETVEAIAWTHSGQRMIRKRMNPKLVVTLDILPGLKDIQVLERILPLRVFGPVVHYIPKDSGPNKHTTEQWKALVCEDSILDETGRIF